MADNEDNDSGAEEVATKPEKKAKAAGTKRKAKKERTGPKRPLSAYMHYCQDKRAETKEANPKATFSELGSILGRQWQELDEDARKPYVKLNEQDKARYEKEKEEMGDDAGAEDGGKKKKAKTTTGKAKKDKDAPKNAKSAYMFFCDAERPRLKAQTPDIEFKELGQLMGANWKKLSDEEKAPYNEQNKQAKIVSKAAKEEYEKTHGKPEKKTKAKKAAGDKKKKKKDEEESAGEDAGSGDD